jgi:hypothetical protein
LDDVEGLTVDELVDLLVVCARCRDEPVIEL